MTYNAVKAPEISLAKALAQQLAPMNIRVNSIAPGSILFPAGSWHKGQETDPEGIADFVLRRRNRARYGAGRHVQLFGSLRQTEMSRCRFKGGESAERRKAVVSADHQAASRFLPSSRMGKPPPASLA